MLLFVNGKTNVMFLRFRMHTHTPQIVTANNRLGKEKQKRNIVRDYTIQCLELIAVIRCYPTTQGKEKL